MKLESSLDFRPALLHVVPLFNVAILFVMVQMFASSSAEQSGLEIDLPVSAATVPPLGDALIVYIGGDTASPRVMMDRELITLDELCQRLEKTKEKPAPVLLRADRQVPHGVILHVSQAALSGGHSVVYATRPPVQPAP